MNHILLFDGLCNLCNGSVNFIIKRDLPAGAGKFKFASLQSEILEIHRGNSQIQLETLP